VALQKAYTDPAGVDHPEAYWRIVMVALDAISRETRVHGLIYHNAASRTGGKESVRSFQDTLAFTASDAASYAVIYNKLKVLPAHIGSLDV
jgi:hypothetical protein